MSLRTRMPIMALGTLFAVSSCVKNPLINTKDYIKKTDRTQIELYKLTDDIDPKNVMSLTILRSRLDSMAYRDLFNTTSAAKDSSKVADFNKIAAKYRANFTENKDKYKCYKKTNVDYKKPINTLIKKLTASNISIKDLDEIKSNTKKGILNLDVVDTNIVRLLNMQYYTDNWAYKKFFEKIGIFNGEMPEKYEKLSKDIKP